MESITTTDINFQAESNDYGNVYTSQCPECGVELVFADFKEDPKCECPRVWRMEIRANGHPLNDGTD